MPAVRYMNGMGQVATLSGMQGIRGSDPCDDDSIKMTPGIPPQRRDTPTYIDNGVDSEEPDNERSGSCGAVRDHLVRGPSRCRGSES